MDTKASPLRQRQAQQVRMALLEAAIRRLEGSGDVSMAEVAEAAGVSLRTLYRYFPDRASLLGAAGDHLYRSLGVPFEITGPEDIAASFREAARRLGTRPRLTRALVRSESGELSRSDARRQRLEAIRGALEPLTRDLDPRTARRASAVIAHLCSAASWTSIADECGLGDPDAQETVGWAIDTLVATLRKEARRSRPRASRKQTTGTRRDDHEPD
jgi:AcrR family transcriptional regulator